MTKVIRVAHYLNQFFGGIGGEESAGVRVTDRQGPVGPGIALERALAGRGHVVKTIICGDNYFNEHEAEALAAVLGILRDQGIDLLVAGPAFNAGRYGLACGRICKGVSDQLGVPSVTAMSPANPAVTIYRRTVWIVPTEDSALGMRAAVEAVVGIGLKLAHGDTLGPPTEEGYVPHGIRRNLFAEETGARRALDMLMARVRGEPFLTELVLEPFEVVPPAPPIGDLSSACIAIATESGVVPIGNPDRLKWARETRWFKYSLAGLDDLTNLTHQAIHGGFDNRWTNEDPDRTLGLDVLRDLEREGLIRGLLDDYYVTCGNGGDLAEMARIGAEIGAQLKERGVHGVISPST